MAWITKDSAGTKVERRAQPCLTPAMRDRLTREILPRYERAAGALLPALHMVQHEHGWISGQAMLEIAEALGLPPADVYDTASFYEEYWLRPRGKHLVAVCRSVACECRGKEAVTQACKDALGVDVGETTGDGRFTLIEVECLGSCGSAPAVLVDETLHENVDPAAIAGLLSEVREPH